MQVTLSPNPFLTSVSQITCAGKTAPSISGVLLGTGIKDEFANYSDKSASSILWINLVLKVTSPFLQEPATVRELISISDLPLGE